MGKLVAYFRQLRAVLHCEAVLLPSPFVFYILEALWCWMLRKPMILLVWDHYPVTINGMRFDRRLRRIVLDTMERLVVLLSTKRIVPTTDFEAIPSLGQVTIVPMWYQKQPDKVDDITEALGLSRPRKSKDKFTKIIFAGQINETRALDLCLSHLDSIVASKAIIFVASRDPFCTEKYENLVVEHVGYLSKRELRVLTKSCAFGLVSLHPLFDGPALPSKTFDYIAAGKPILYFGKNLPYYTQLLSRFAIGVDFSDLDRLDLDSDEWDKPDLKLRQHAFQSALALDREKFVAEVLETLSHSDNPTDCDFSDG